MEEHIITNSDGGARGNPGPAAIGVLVRRGKEILEIKKKTIGKATNNIAEYHALIEALKLAVKHTKKEVLCCLDSELVVKQLKGEYAVRKIELKPLFLTVKELENNFEQVTYKHVRRTDEFQKKVDKMVNQMLDEED
jgi:ribonuclease HI